MIHHVRCPIESKEIFNLKQDYYFVWQQKIPAGLKLRLKAVIGLFMYMSVAEIKAQISCIVIVQLILGCLNVELWSSGRKLFLFYIYNKVR